MKEMKLIDFINMIIKENFRPRKIKLNKFKYVLVSNINNYCEYDYYCDATKEYLLSLYDLDDLIADANEEIEIVEE